MSDSEDERAGATASEDNVDKLLSFYQKFDGLTIADVKEAGKAFAEIYKKKKQKERDENPTRAELQVAWSVFRNEKDGTLGEKQRAFYDSLANDEVKAKTRKIFKWKIFEEEED